MGLDAANQPNSEATLFAKLILAQVAKQKPEPQIFRSHKTNSQLSASTCIEQIGLCRFRRVQLGQVNHTKAYAPL